MVFKYSGLPVVGFEGNEIQRCVVIEFESVASAVAAYESPAYQAALAVLRGKAEWEVRILEGRRLPAGGQVS